jgi:hypothetical protein
MFIGREQGRLSTGTAPDELCVSVITVAELRLGVLNAPDLSARAARLETLTMVESLEAIQIDDAVAAEWALLVARLRSSGRKAPVNDCWIAATALANGLPVATQDADYDGIPELTVLRL